MTKASSTTRSATSLENSRLMQILIKSEEDIQHINVSNSQEVAISAIDSPVKVEENDADLKPTLES